jgi:hypothetical protein
MHSETVATTMHSETERATMYTPTERAVLLIKRTFPHFHLIDMHPLFQNVVLWHVPNSIPIMYDSGVARLDERLTPPHLDDSVCTHLRLRMHNLVKFVLFSRAEASAKHDAVSTIQLPKFK